MKTQEYLLRKSDVISITGLSDSTIRRLELSDDFPSRLQISRNAVAWKGSEIQQWIESRLQSKGGER